VIKLWNHTPIADAPIRSVLTWAACKVGVPGDVCVKVTGNRYIEGRWSGLAHSSYVRIGYLQGKTIGHWGEKLAKTYGWFEVALDCGTAARNKREVEYSESFIHTALHEMSHIKDYRGWTPDNDPRTTLGRRIAHDKRPSELRAENRVYDITTDKRNKKRIEELTLALAIAIEESGKPL
jgi:hypothetical protein